MKSTLLTYIDRFRQNRRERLVLGSVLLFLAVIVSLIVYWQLRYTGITMSNETFCGYEEHVHAEECYDEEGNLVCELEEHSHTVDCLINLNADVEDATVWKATLPELTGDLRTDVVNIAYSQLGYTESTANFSPGEDGVTRYGYTRYGAWYGNEYGTWDAMFVSFCLNYAGVDRTAFPLNSGAYSWAVELSEIGSYAEASAYTPLAGDIVFFDSDYDGRIDRVGIVASTDISGGVVTIIEGDYTVSEVDTVCEHIYALNDPTISGYGIIAASEEAEEETEAEETDDETEDTEESEEIEIEETEDTEETEEETEESPTLFYTASDSGVNVTVIAPEGALPDGAALAVTLLDEESDEYAEAAEAVGYEDSEDTGMAALDITFYDELGIEVEPSLPVTVTVDITEIIPEGTTADTIEVTHITDTEVSTVETLVETVTDTTDETAVVVFETESFSTFTLRWSYGRDNNNYKNVTVYLLDENGDEISVSSTSTITLSSGTSANLKELFSIEGYTCYLAEVQTVTTSTAPPWEGGGTTYTYTTIDSDASTITYVDNMGETYFTIDGTTYNNLNNATVIINLYYKVASASITINKYETNTTTQLSGATFTLTSSVSLADVTSDGSFTLSDDGYTITFTTTSSAIKFSNLPEGNYTLTETSAPSGYTKADESFTFTVSGNSIESTSTSTSTDGSYTYSSNAVSFYDDPEPTYTFDIVWHASGASSLNASISSYFDTNGNGTYVLDDGTLSAVDIDSTLYVGYNNEVDFDDNNALLAVSGYTLNSATLYVNGSTTGITDVATLRSVYDWTNKVWTYSYLTIGSSTWITLSNVTSLAVDLYYEIEDTAITGDLTISDDVANSGSIVATYTGSGTVDHYIWYQYDSDNSTWTEVGEYGSSLEVYVDGARQIYRVQAIDSSGNVLATSASYQVPYYDQLQNGSFEYPAIDTSASGNIQITNNLYYEYVWQTTGEGTGNKEGQDLELINASTGGSDYGETTAADGNQYAELNCEATGTLYQDVMTIPDVPLYWNFSHEGRDGTDSMCVIIVDAEYAEANITTQDDIDAIYAAAVQAAGGSLTAITEDVYSTGSVTFDYDGVSITLWLITSDNDTWHSYYGEYTVPDGQYLTRFLFASVSGTTTGNLIDGISFSQTAPVSDDSVNITVTKVVSGLDEDEVVAAGTYTFEVYNSSGNSVGTISFPIADATASQTYYWTYTFTELKADSNYYVVETINSDISGYTHSSTTSTVSTANVIGTETSGSFALSNGDSSVVTFTNNYTKDETYSGPEMPQTGGRGTKLYTTVGLLLICSGGYLLYRTLKQQKRKCNRRWNI